LNKDGVQTARTLQQLSEAGIDLNAVTQQLEDEGVQKFTKAFDVLMNTLKEKQSQTLSRTQIEPTEK